MTRLITGTRPNDVKERTAFSDKLVKQMKEFYEHRKTCKICDKNPMKRCEEGNKLLGDKWK